MAEKQQEQAKIQSTQSEKQKLYREFWGKLLSVANTKSSLFANISPSDNHRLSA
jgi:hypothetical protein